MDFNRTLNWLVWFKVKSLLLSALGYTLLDDATTIRKVVSFHCSFYL